LLTDKDQGMKDYYAILGIAPSAEEVVIRAAWKALSQRYHPDRYVGDVSKANARMVEINEAYSILSDPIRRQTYDKSRSGKEGDFAEWVHEEEAGQATNSFDPLEKDWALAVDFYPDLVSINNRLSKISSMLAFSYRASLLERKAFEKRKSFAEKAEESFLESYFGSNKKIVDFALELILAGNKAAAKALNDSIRVLGSEVSPNRVIKKICKDFNFETEEMKSDAERMKWGEEKREKTNAWNNAVEVGSNESPFLPWGVSILIFAIFVIIVTLSIIH